MRTKSDHWSHFSADYTRTAITTALPSLYGRPESWGPCKHDLMELKSPFGGREGKMKVVATIACLDTAGSGKSRFA